MTDFLVSRDVTTDECEWLDETVKQGTVVHKFYGATYGCIGPSGVAVIFSEKTPFFELPYDALTELPIR
jgi:hypothetical protein